MTTLNMSQKELNGLYLPDPTKIEGKDDYKNNTRLRPRGMSFAYTPEHIEEYARCADPETGLEYFLSKYYKIETSDGDLIQYDPFPYQTDFAKKSIKHRLVLMLSSRQSGKTTGIVGVLLWNLIFNRRYNIAITANKLSQAIEILDRIKIAYEWVPLWMQQGIVRWMGTRLELENKSKITSYATSMSGIRGKSLSCVYMDEFSHIHPNTQKKFFESVFPAISAGKKTKLFVSTTPNGLDMFYKMWTDSINGKNDFARVETHWSQKPGRDQAWADAEIARIGQESFDKEYNCEFQGSSGTLINGRILSTIPTIPHIEKTSLGLKIFSHPEKDHTYVVTVDVSRGLGLDYQACVIFDVTSFPYKVVASYRNNKLPPSLLHEIVFNVCTYYNEAMVMVETNDVGLRVAEDLMQVDEYENIMMTQVKSKSGTRLGAGFGSDTRYGMKTTIQTKRIGCTNLKQLIERGQLVINDEDILWELSRFIGKGNTYGAEEGSHDDLVMCLVIFAWITDQQFFKESVATDFRTSLVNSGGDVWNEDDLVPFGLISDGHEEEIVL